MEEKRCSKCKKLKAISEFYERRAVCKDCMKEHRKEYHKEYNKEYYKQNAEKLNEQKKEYYKQNVEKLKEYYKEYHKEYYKQNVEKKKGRNKEYYKQNAEKFKEYSKQTRVCINGNNINISTAPEEIKPFLEKIIQVRNLKQELKNNKKILLGENNG
jgi:hypothetical protein